jgi:hypothetical protein
MKRWFGLFSVLFLSLPALGHSVTLTWKPEPKAEQYIVYRATGDDAYEEIADLPASASSFQDKSVTGGGQYCYEVQWVARGYAGYVGKPICVEVPRDKK